MSKSGKSVSKTSSDNNSDQKKASTLVYRYKDVKFDNIEVSELNKEASQPIAYINYNDVERNAKTKILMQSGKIKITSHGIPALDKPDSKTNFYPDDSKREFIKVPLDPLQPACVELIKHLEKVDNWAGSEEMRKKLFGKRASKYQYQSCIKTPKVEDANGDGDSDEENKEPKKTRKDKNGKEYPIVDYVKMKFNIVPSGKGKINKTVLKRIEGGKKVSVRADTITDIANEIKFLSEIRFVFYYNKIWANKNPAPGATVIPYGIGFKIMAIEYTPSAGKSVDPEEIEFMSSDEEDDEVSPNKKAKMDDEENSSSDKEEKENNSEDEEKKTKGKKNGSDTPGKKSKGKQVVEENEDEEENKEISPKKSSKKSKKAKIEDEDKEQDEEISPKKNSKKSSKKSKKAKIEDEDEDDEEEEIKPNKKGKSASKNK